MLRYNTPISGEEETDLPCVVTIATAVVEPLWRQVLLSDDYWAKKREGTICGGPETLFSDRRRNISLGRWQNIWWPMAQQLARLQQWLTAQGYVAACKNGQLQPLTETASKKKHNRQTI